MSAQEWRPPNRAPGGNGGSVKRARERVEAGLPPDVPQQPQQIYYENPKMVRQENRQRPQMPPGLATRSGQGPIGVAISRPTQVTQWPLAATVEGVPDPRSNPNYQPPPGRSGPPQRPPRPRDVPSMLDASKLQQPLPTFQYRPPTQPEPTQSRRAYEDDEILSPVPLSPTTQSSRPSTYSSVGSIPDFPIPSQQSSGPPMPPPGPLRRSMNLGPPPSSRRGASSYYSQASFVSPIPEESPRQQASHGSYASSAAMPTSWGSNSPEYAYDEEDDDYDSPRIFQAEQRFGYKEEERGDSRDSNVDDDDRGLIRSASFGRRAKPSMIVTTKHPEKTEQLPTGSLQAYKKPPQIEKLEKMGIIVGRGNGVTADSTLSAPITREPDRNTLWPIMGNIGSPLESGTGLIDKTPSTSEEESPVIARAITTNDATPSYFPQVMDPRAEAILGAYNAASSTEGYSRMSAIRRPPRLDMDAVRDAEARGSLTSLPDLIRRATKLAAMMERGKRPGSRMGLADYPDESDLVREKELGSSVDEKYRSGLSGMLAAFPPPGRETPRGDTPNRPGSWPQAYGTLGSVPNSKDGPPKPRGRRCCKLPCWGFLLLLLVIAIIIAAAVVVPVKLLILDKPRSTTPPRLSAIQQCEAAPLTACQNGGSSLLDNGNCACICTNGFTGSTCTTANATGCTTTTLTGSAFNNVTLGDSISRLISGASNFSIPLSESVLLARFSSNNLSCVSENALVTFDGQSQRRGGAKDIVTPVTASPTIKRIRRRTSTLPSVPPAATSNGIVFDPTTPNPTNSTSSSPSPTTSATSSQNTNNPLSPFKVTEEVLDFARVVTLFILQQETLDSAVNAQSILQHFFNLNEAAFTMMAAMNVTLGGDNTVDLARFTLDLGGVLIGGRNPSITKRG